MSYIAYYENTSSNITVTSASVAWEVALSNWLMVGAPIFAGVISIFLVWLPSNAPWSLPFKLIVMLALVLSAVVAVNAFPVQASAVVALVAVPVKSPINVLACNSPALAVKYTPVSNTCSPVLVAELVVQVM